MLAALSTALMVLVQSSYAAWSRHEADHETRQAGIAVLRHIVRQARQATSVVAISGPTDNSGSLSLLTASGSTIVWDHNATTNQVLYGVTTATQVLANDIEELTFLGIRTDGVTTSTDVGLIHSIKATTTVTLERPAGATEDAQASCQAWLRAW